MREVDDQYELEDLIKSLERTWEVAFPNGIDLVSHCSKPSGSVTDSKLVAILDDPKSSDVFGSLADRTHPNAHIHRRWALAAIMMLIKPHDRVLKARQAQVLTRDERYTPPAASHQQGLPFASLQEVSVRITLEGNSLGVSYPIGHFLEDRHDRSSISALAKVSAVKFDETIYNTLKSAAPKTVPPDYLLMFRTSQPSGGTPKDGITDTDQLLAVVYQAANCLFEEGVNWRVAPASLMSRKSVHAVLPTYPSKGLAPEEHAYDSQHRKVKTAKRNSRASPHKDSGNLSR